MFRATLGVALSTLFLTASTICQSNSHPVSAKVKEMLLIQQAEKGDRDAQAEIVSRAEKGDPQAQAALGDNYEYGYWVTKDPAEALRWYQKAAEKGDRGAREILGQMYFDGDGVRRDFGEAAKWFGCPKPSEAILASCKETRYQDLPQGARGLLKKMKCEVRTGSNYDYGSVVDLTGTEQPAFQFCCSESPHGPCGAVVIGEVGAEWTDLSAKGGLLGFNSACGGFLVLESQHNGFHDVCLPNECSPAALDKDGNCSPTIWQFGKDHYHSIANGIPKIQR
jgi:hypothetical protein